MFAITPRTGVQWFKEEAARQIRKQSLHTVVAGTTMLIHGLQVYNSYMLMGPSEL